MNTLSDVFGTKNNTQVTKPVNAYQATNPADPMTMLHANQQATGGEGPASGTIGRQNLLNDQLAAAAAGGGPNPALEQLKQTTSQNVNNAAGMAASGRGVNPAMAAKTAVNAASGANQTAAGQAATMTAQQQIAAREQLGQNLNSTGQMQLGQQQGGIGLLGTAGGLDLGAQRLNQATAGQNAGLDLGAQQLQAGVAGQNAATNGAIAGGILQGGGAALGLFAEGGEVSANMPGGGPGREYLMSLHAPLHFAEGGEAGGDDYLASGAGYEGAETPTNLPGDPSKAGKAAGAGVGAFGQSLAQAGQQGLDAFRSLTARPVLGSIYAHGGRVDAMVSPGEKVVPPGTSPSEAAQLVHKSPSIPGRAQVDGDSPQNDTIHAKLTAGSVVLPRSVVNSRNPGKAASSFVASVLRRSGGGKYRGGPVQPKTSKEAGPSVEANMDAYDAIDLSAGGLVKPAGAKNTSAAGKPEEAGPGAKSETARGLGRDRHRNRIKTAGDKPMHRD